MVKIKIYTIKREFYYDIVMAEFIVDEVAKISIIQFYFEICSRKLVKE